MNFKIKVNHLLTVKCFVFLLSETVNSGVFPVASVTHGCFAVLGLPGVGQFVELILGVVQVQGQLWAGSEYISAAGW